MDRILQRSCSAGKPGDEMLSGASLSESKFLVVIIMAMVVSEPSISRNDVKYDFASFKVEAELQFA